MLITPQLDLAISFSLLLIGACVLCWFSFRSIRARGTPHISSDVEQVARARFQSTQPKPETDSIRAAPQEVAEPQDNP